MKACPLAWSLGRRLHNGTTTMKCSDNAIKYTKHSPFYLIHRKVCQSAQFMSASMLLIIFTYIWVKVKVQIACVVQFHLSNFFCILALWTVRDHCTLDHCRPPYCTLPRTHFCWCFWKQISSRPYTLVLCFQKQLMGQGIVRSAWNKSVLNGSVCVYIALIMVLEVL